MSLNLFHYIILIYYIIYYKNIKLNICYLKKYKIIKMKKILNIININY